MKVLGRVFNDIQDDTTNKLLTFFIKIMHTDQRLGKYLVLLKSCGHKKKRDL